MAKKPPSKPATTAPKKKGAVWLVGPDGKKFQKRKDESNAQALTRRTRHLKREQIINLVTLGWSIRRAIERAGFHHSTVYDWVEKDPDFATRLKTAAATALGEVEEAGFKQAKLPEGIQDRRLILRARGGYTFELAEHKQPEEDDVDPRDIEVQLVDGDGNPL